MSANARLLRLGAAALFLAAACGGSVASQRSSTVTDAGSDGSGSSSGAVPGTDSGSSSGSSSGASDGGGGSDVHESDTIDEPPPPCAAPTFSPPSGSVDPGSVTITDPDVVGTDGFIFYTLDGTNPTVNSLVYQGPIQVTASETFRAVAQNLPKCGMSPVTSASYQFEAPDCCGGPYVPPVLTPGSKISDNDFLVDVKGL
ncbi:MAG TPA: chitobiase/beta-hexosaminidase C-terminal domain-containing protein, partial [Polyangiaceae bacterium]